MLDPEIAIIPAAAHTGVQSSDDLTSHVEDAGAMFLLNITDAPNTAGTLTLVVEAKDEASDNYVAITAFAATEEGEELGAGTTLAYSVYPSAAETTAVPDHEIQALPIPRHFRVRVEPTEVEHTAEEIEEAEEAEEPIPPESWTYSVSYQPLGG